MNLRRIHTVFRKELVDTLRDKRTLVMMMGVPLVLYPAMLLIGVQAALVQHEKLSRTVSRVALETSDNATVQSWLDHPPKNLAAFFEALSEVDSVAADSVAASDAKFRPIMIVPSENPEQDLADGKIDAVVVAKGDVTVALREEAVVSIEVRFDSTEFASREAASRVEAALRTAEKAIRAERLARVGLLETYIQPFKTERKDVAPPAKTTGFMLGLLLPVIMVVMIALGAFYPAVDLTAGEKERGTFETLLSTPISKMEIVTGKFLTVFCLAMATSLLNLASMAATAAFMAYQLSSAFEGEVALELQPPVGAFFWALLAMIPLALFISALMMSVAVFARSFKEAQNYITPFFLIITLPAAVAGFPSARLTPFTAFIPVANVVLLFRALMTGKAGFDAAFAVFLSTAAYALLALLFAAWLFQREEVILSEERGIPLSIRRSEFRPSSAPTPGMSLALFAFILVLIFYGGSLAQQRHLIGGLLFTEWVLILLPTLFLLWFARIDLRKALGMASLSPLGFAGALLSGPAAVVLIIQVGLWNNEVLPMPESIESVFKDLLAFGDTPWKFVVLFFAVAVSPAICEEALFRGAILSGLRQRLGVAGSILLVSGLFGLFHLSVYRVVPTGLIGVLLTYLVLRTGSILSGILVHFMTNGISILIATGTYPPVVASFLQLDKVEQQGLSYGVLIAAAGVLVSGIALVEAGRRRA